MLCFVCAQIKTALRMGIEPRVEMSFADEKTIIEYQDLGAKSN